VLKSKIIIMKNFSYNGKHIGKLEGDFFYKKVDKSKHFMKIYDSWAIDERVLKDLAPITKIYYEDIKLKTIWATTAKEWTEKGFERDFGFGKQIFLKEVYFTKQSSSQRPLF